MPGQLVTAKTIIPSSHQKNKDIIVQCASLSQFGLLQLHLGYLWNELANEARKNSKLCYEVDNFYKTQDTYSTTPI